MVAQGIVAVVLARRLALKVLHNRTPLPVVLVTGSATWLS
jgi:hypothetical protein